MTDVRKIIGDQELIVRFRAKGPSPHGACMGHYPDYPVNDEIKDEFVSALDFKTMSFIVMHLECWNRYWEEKNWSAGKEMDGKATGA